MWIVRIALDRPYTFIVLALLILIVEPGGDRSARPPTSSRTSTSRSSRWPGSTPGSTPKELEGRITTSYERVLTTTVDNIQHIESTTVNGQAIIKIFLQPNASLDTANAQITAISQTVLRQFPPGIAAAADHQLQRVERADPAARASPARGSPSSSSSTSAVNFLRPQLVTIPGVAIPYPYGGKQRQVMVDLDTRGCCRPRAWPPPTCSPPSTSRTSSCPPGRPRSASSSTT